MNFCCCCCFFRFLFISFFFTLLFSNPLLSTDGAARLCGVSGGKEEVEEEEEGGGREGGRKEGWEASRLKRSSLRDSQVLMVIAADGVLRKLPRDSGRGEGTIEGWGVRVGDSRGGESKSLCLYFHPSPSKSQPGSEKKTLVFSFHFHCYVACICGGTVNSYLALKGIKKAANYHPGINADTPATRNILDQLGSSVSKIS